MSRLEPSDDQLKQGLSGTPEKFNVPQRVASLIRFREKRKERNFEKKIRYTVRKEVALRHVDFSLRFPHIMFEVALTRTYLFFLHIFFGFFSLIVF